MKKIVLCPNVERDLGFSVTLSVRQMLTEAGYEVVVSPVYGTADSAGIPSVPLDKAMPGASLMVTLGGDGTILHLAPRVMTYEVPLVGVNLGHKGFLTELTGDSLGLLLDAAAGHFEIVPRMMLDVQLVRNGEVVYADTALNEALVSGIVQNIRLTACGDGARILAFSGDGIIVSSPTGSTAYSMAAGGPLVEPNADALILTPICAHMLAARSFVLASDRTVTVTPLELDTDRRCVLSADGRGMIDLQDGDTVIVKKSKHKLLTAHLGTKSFYETAFEKLGERE